MFMRGSLPIDTLLSDPATVVRAPSESTADKVHFLFNNLSAQNLEAKSKEIRELLPAQYDGWVANYIVVRSSPSVEYCESLTARAG